MFARALRSQRVLGLSALLFALASLGAACGGEPNTLDGSIAENFDLSFDRTSLQLFASSNAMRLEYLRDLETGGVEVVARVVFDVPAGGIVADEEIDILANNGVIQRVTNDGGDFPEPELATITFEEGGNDAGPAKGRFVTTFDNGKTLNGDFEAELEVL